MPSASRIRQQEEHDPGEVTNTPGQQSWTDDLLDIEVLHIPQLNVEDFTVYRSPALDRSRSSMRVSVRDGRQGT